MRRFSRPATLVITAAWVAVTVAGTGTALGAETINGPMAGQLAHARHAAYSTNWAGWVATAGGYSSVRAAWTQPRVSCAQRETSYSSFWVGLDGAGSDSVEQTGTEADCRNGTATYSSWYEFYPGYPGTYSVRVSPGDAITAAVTWVRGSQRYTTTLTDHTRGWTRSSSERVGSARRASAEVIAEAPADGRTGAVLPLSRFGTVRFSAVVVDGAGIGSNATAAWLTMISASGAVKASTSSVARGSGFSVTRAAIRPTR